MKKHEILLLQRELEQLNRQCQEQSRADCLLSEVVNRFVNFFERIDEGLIILDRSLKVHYFNGAAEKIWGLSRDQVVGSSLAEAFPEIRGSVFEKKIIDGLKAQKTMDFEICIAIEPDQNWYKVVAVPDQNSVLVFFRDITPQKEQEQSIEGGQYFLHILFHEMDQGALLLNRSGLICSANAGVQCLLGQSQNDVIGQNFLYFEWGREHDHALTVSEKACFLKAILSHPKRQPLYIKGCSLSKNSQVWYQAKAVPLVDAQGRTVQTLILMKNI